MSASDDGWAPDPDAPADGDIGLPADPTFEADAIDAAEGFVDPDAATQADDGEAEPAPSVARVAASILGHTGSWAAAMSLRAGRRLADAVTDPAASVELMRDLAEETTRVIQTVAEAADLDRRLEQAGPAGALVRRTAELIGEYLPAPPPPPDPAMAVRHSEERRVLSLREQGEELLRRSRDVNDGYDAHPAYARILLELAPDEARILSLMLTDGPQPTVDVRTGGPLGLISSRLIAPGLSMIGARAGCRYVERVPSYLNNLFRLGLIWFSHETLRDHQRYQVLEAQPDVLAAIHSVTAARVIRRSVHLTPFGEDFCRVCLAEAVSDFRALPPHSTPPARDSFPQPPDAHGDR